MTPKVILIASTAVLDWPELLSLTKQALGRSISRGLDTSQMSPSHLAAFVCALDELENPGQSHPVNSIVKAGHLLDFISFTFMVACDIDLMYNIMKKTNLNVIEEPTVNSSVYLAIISGTASAYREAAINLCCKSESTEIRSLLNQITNQLDRVGLKDMFKDYRREQQQDQTFLLTYRK